jgi:hypothetical protein
MPKSSDSKSNDSGLNSEAPLWAAAGKMRGHIDASEYKYVCLGFIFLKYISDAFEKKSEQLRFGYFDLNDEPQRAEAAENRAFSVSSSNGDVRTLRRDKWNTPEVKADRRPNERARRGRWDGVRCRKLRMNSRGIHRVLRKRWPCAGISGDMFDQSDKFVKEHGYRMSDIADYRQDKSVRGQPPSTAY